MPLNYSVLKVVHVKSKQKLNCSVIFLAIKGGKDSQKEKSSEVNSKKLKNECHEIIKDYGFNYVMSIIKRDNFKSKNLLMGCYH